MNKWQLFTMDENMGSYRTKAEAVANAQDRSCADLKPKRIRPGVYEYVSHIKGEDTSRTYYVLTQDEAAREGFVYRAEILD